jgi:hypothetical protein
MLDFQPEMISKPVAIHNFYCAIYDVSLLSGRGSAIMNVVRLLSVLLELNLAAVASRSSLMGALIRTANPSNLHSVLDFLTGLSCGELECLAEFQGACLLEMTVTATNPYRMLAEFFDPAVSERWRNCEDRAHKTFIVLSWLEVQHTPQNRALALHIA